MEHHALKKGEIRMRFWSRNTSRLIARIIDFAECCVISGLGRVTDLNIEENRTTVLIELIRYEHVFIECCELTVRDPVH